jgi:transposase-like protein
MDIFLNCPKCNYPYLRISDLSRIKIYPRKYRCKNCDTILELKLVEENNK